MSTALAERAVPSVVCDGCGQNVLAIFTTSQHPVRLDADPVPGGLYVVDEHNRARRRTLVELYSAERQHQPTPGFDVHECRVEPWFAR